MLRFEFGARIWIVMKIWVWSDGLNWIFVNLNMMWPFDSNVGTWSWSVYFILKFNVNTEAEIYTESIAVFLKVSLVKISAPVNSVILNNLGGT